MRATGTAGMGAGRWALAGLIFALAAFAGPAWGDEKPKEKTWHLEFRIVANEKDDADGIGAAAKYLKAAKDDDKLKAELQKLAEEGEPPPAGEVVADKPLGYAWAEIGPAELRSLGLDAEGDSAFSFEPSKEIREAIAEGHKKFREQVAKARQAGEAYQMTDPPFDGWLFFSRPCQTAKLSKEERKKKEYDYFLLTRLPERGKGVTGEHLIEVKRAEDSKGRRAVAIHFDKAGGDLLYELTSANQPKAGEDSLSDRSMAVIVDGTIISAPVLYSKIRDKAQISGDFTSEQIDAIVEAIRKDLPEKDK